MVTTLRSGALWAAMVAWFCTVSGPAMMGGLATPARAQVPEEMLVETPRPAPDASSSAAPGGRVVEDRVLALPAIAATGADLLIAGSYGWVELQIPLEEAVTVRTAVLRLTYTSSPALVVDRSQLLVEINDDELAELPAAPRRGSTRVDVAIPGDLLIPGVNRLTIRGWQEHRNGCDRDALAELWTRIDPINSYLRLEVERPDRSPVLADVQSPHWPQRIPEPSVSVITTTPIESDHLLRIGGLIAQGFALRYDEEAVIVRHRLLQEAPAFDPAALGLVVEAEADPLVTLTGPILPAGHHVLVGTREQLLPILGPASAAEIVGPYLGMHRLSDDPASAYLVVSGPDGVALEEAAIAFANPALPLPEAPVLIVADPPTEGQAERRFLAPGRTYVLTDLTGTDTAMDTGLAQRTAFEFFLPPDFYVADNRKAILRLDYGYKPDLASNSALHVMINGYFAGLIPLDTAAGELVEGREIRLPLRLFRPGRNVLAFQPAILGSDEAGCGVPPDGPSVAIFAGSTLHVPEVARVVPQLDLQLFESLAYPYADPVLEPEASLVFAAGDSDTISAGWTLLGRLAQSAGRPLTTLALGFGRGDESGHRILIGPITALDARILAQTPIQRVPLQPGDPDARAGRVRPRPAQVSVIAVDVADDPLGVAEAGGSERQQWQQRLGLPAAPEMSVLEQGTAALDGIVRSAAASVRTVLPDGWIWLANDRPPRFLHERSRRFDGVIAALPAPDAAGQTLTIVTAADPTALLLAVTDLIKPAIWHELSGDIGAWNVGVPGADVGRIHARQSLTDVPTGFRQRLLFVNSYLAETPLLWTGLVVLGLVTMAVLTGLALRRE